MPGMRRSIVSAVVVLAALSLAGCTSVPLAGQLAAQSSLSAAAEPAHASARTLWASTLQTLAAATSARVKGTVVTSSLNEDLEIAGTRDGTNSWTRFTANGALVEVIMLPDAHYTRGNAAFWKTGGLSDEKISMIGTKYVKVATNKAAGTKSIGDEIDVVTKAAGAATDIAPFTVESTTLNGTSAYLLSRSLIITDQKIWLAADAGHDLLRFQQTGTNSIDLTFSEWDAVAAWTAPPADLVYSSH